MHATQYADDPHFIDVIKITIETSDKWRMRRRSMQDLVQISHKIET